MSDHVIVVTQEPVGIVMKVCGSWDAYDDWLESSGYNESDGLKAVEAKVYR